MLTSRHFFPKLCLLAIVVLTALYLTGCAVSNIDPINKTSAGDSPYGRIMVMFTEIPMDLYALDMDSYDEHLRGNFNDLDNYPYRKSLEQSFLRKLSNHISGVVKSSDVFEVNTDILYEDFLDQVGKTGVGAILLVNMKGYWTEFVDEDIPLQPNATFNVYLIDVLTGKPVWIANSSVLGVYYAGNGTLNNRLASKVSRHLAKQRIIYSPRYASNHR